MSLFDLKVGDIAVITYIEKDCPFYNRLTKMGINIDETIRVLNVSIFGTPILINVCGYNLCVGKNIAKKIIVKTVLDNFKA